ncbi:MAG: hypothetical protein FWE28_07895 [Oscillospiraceae bacterium]|nr:hypothetical protein [Oscillospiraceae bacterium]
MNNRSNKEMTSKQAGNMVKHMIADVENKMAAGTQISGKPSSEEEEKALQKTREANQR